MWNLEGATITGIRCWKSKDTGIMTGIRDLHSYYGLDACVTLIHDEGISLLHSINLSLKPWVWVLTFPLSAVSFHGLSDLDGNITHRCLLVSWQRTELAFLNAHFTSKKTSRKSETLCKPKASMLKIEISCTFAAQKVIKTWWNDTLNLHTWKYDCTILNSSVFGDHSLLCSFPFSPRVGLEEVVIEPSHRLSVCVYLGL